MGFQGFEELEVGKIRFVDKFVDLVACLVVYLGCLFICELEL